MEILGLIDIPTWLLVVLFLVLAYYIYGTWTFGAFKDSGLPGPKPYVLVGTLGSMFRKGFHVAEPEYLKNYGKTFAMFDGRQPSIYTTDEDLIRAVTVKDFQYFMNHRSVKTVEPFNSMLTALKDEEWRRVRNLLSPTFSTGKLKKMIHQINQAAMFLAKNLEEHATKGTSFEVKKYGGAFSMDTIAATAFGLQLDSQNDLNNKFVKMARKLFDITIFNPMMLVVFFFPFLLPLFAKLNISIFPRDVSDFFGGVIEKTMEEKKQNAKKDVDFLQLMMDAHNDESTENDVTDPAIHQGASETKQVKKGLSYQELLSQGIIFFIAGYETTAQALSYLLYNLTIYPEAQEKVYEEIQKHVKDSEIVDYSMLSEMPYLDHCVNETLRLYPPAPRTDRECRSDVTVNGIHIKKGWMIVFPIYGMHRSPEYWEDPEEFKPERFAEKGEHNYHFMPFGAGPRNCIGMRLALMEVKIAAVQVLRKYKLVKTEETQFPIKFQKLKAMSPEKPIKLGVEIRQ